MTQRSRSTSPGNTTYYIDANTGSDTHAGTDPSRPWQSFARVNAMTLAAGDCINVLAPGSFEQGLVITGQGSAQSPIAVQFAPGRYDIFATQGPTRRYNISNCNAQPDGDKAIAILIEHASHVRIEAPGTRIVCRSKMIELCIDHSQSVFALGLQFDYHRPTVSEMTVTHTTDTCAEVLVHSDSWYQVHDGRLIWQGEGWNHEDGLAQELVPDTGKVWRRAGLLDQLTVEQLSQGHLRLQGDHRMVTGRVFQIRNPFRDCVGVLINRSEDVTLLQVDLFFMHGMGVLCQFTRNITLDRVAIAPEQGSGRTTAAWADCMHFSGCAGSLEVTNCTFRGAHDDAINVHGTYLRIAQKLGPRQIKVQFMHRQTYGFAAFNDGDKIALVHADTLERYATTHIAEARMSDPKSMLLTLEDDVPEQMRDSDVVENMTWTPQVEIRSCQVSHIPTRGFLVSTPRRAVIQDNEIVRTHMPGILVACDANHWFESGSPGELHIIGNRFVECRQHAIEIEPRSDTPSKLVGGQVLIRNNVFVLADGSAARVSRCAAVTVTDNDIATSSETETFQIDQHCTNVHIDGNTIKQPDRSTGQIDQRPT